MQVLLSRLTLILCAIGFVFFSVSNSFAQQTGTIRGKATDTHNQPIANVNLSLLSTSRGDASNQKGEYIIKNIPAGNYTFVASGVGFRTERKQITLKSGQTLTVNIRLSRSNQELQEIVVSAEKVNKFTDTSSDYVAKVPLKDIENPQVYNSISSELLNDQVITSFDDALKNAPGIFKLWESTGRGGDGAGYYSIRGFSVQPQLENGLPALTNGSLDPANIEKIELVKGPSATLFGNSVTSYGGLINVVTKKPYDHFGGDVSYKTGSFGLNRVTADLNTPVGKRDNVLLRVTSAYEKGNSFQDQGFHESFFIAPTLQYKVNDDLSFLVNTEFYRPEHTNQFMLFLNRSAQLEARNPDELGYNNDLSYTSNDLTVQNPTFSLQGQMNYDLSDTWHSQTVISRSSAQSEGYYSYFSTIGLPKNTYGRYVSDQNSTTNGTDLQQNFTGNFELGSIGNKLLVGLDFFQQTAINNNTGYITYDTVNLQNPNPPVISKAVADTMLATTGVGNSKTQQQVYSAYASDVIELLPQLSVMASVRLDHFANDGSVYNEDDGYNQTTLSPKFGVIFQPIEDKLSLFANYMNGFSNVAPITVGDKTFTFSPERANQWETGVKANLLDGRLNATASYYDITVSNVVRQLAPEEYTQEGENYSRGVEFSVTTSPVEGLNIVAGYSHNISKIQKTDSDNLRGLRPEQAGPQDLVNGWMSYHITNGALRGFGLGFGGNYASDNYIINRQSTGRFTVPAYTVLNASAFFNTVNYRLDLKVNNLTDKKYYNGWSTLNPQAPCNVIASFTYKF